ncbi:hypothetical protein PXQ59_002157 [Vibrio parahaemolyticus]|nr:hypothetical protein [Vibrio parahaemolyticus]
MSISKIIATTLIILSFSFSMAEPEKKIDEVSYKISDCYSYTNKTVSLNKQYKEGVECVNELRKENEINDLNIKSNTSIFENIVSFILNVLFAISLVIGAYAAIPISYKFLRKFFNKEPINIAKLTTGIALFSLAGAIISNPFSKDYVVDFIMKATDNEIKARAAFENKINGGSEIGDKLILDEYVQDTALAAKKIGYGIVKSELCSLEYIENEMTMHDYPIADYYPETESAVCFSEKMAEAQTKRFMERGGRSARNYAVKQCSDKLSSRDIDCGFFHKVEIDESTESSIVNLINSYEKEFVAAAEEYDAAFCSSLNTSLMAETELQAYCRDWNGKQFELKSTDLKRHEINKMLVNLNERLMSELAGAIAQDIHNRGEVSSELELFNIFDLANGLTATGIDEKDLDSKIIDTIRTIQYNYPLTVSEMANEKVLEKTQTTTGIASLNSYYQELNSVLDNVYASDEMATKTTNQFLKVLKDPKLFFGEYTKNGYEVSANPLKAINEQSFTIGVFWLSAKLQSKSMQNIGKMKGDKALQTAGYKLEKLLGTLLFAIVIAIAFPTFVQYLVFVKMIFSTISNILIVGFGSFMSILTRQNPDKVVMSIFNLMLLPTRLSPLFISIKLTGFLTGLFYDIFTGFGFEVVEVGIGTQFILPIIYLIFYVLLISYFFITIYLTANRIVEAELKLSNVLGDLGTSADSVGIIMNKVKKQAQ